MLRKWGFIVIMAVLMVGTLVVPAQAQRQHAVVFLQYSDPGAGQPDRLLAVTPGNTPIVIAEGRPIYQMAASHLSTYVAFVDSDPQQNGVWMGDLRLKVFSLATLSSVFDVPLTGIETTPTAAWDAGSALWEPLRAITDVTSLAWSPDGTQLAFMGAKDGPSSDLYVYSLRNGDVIRLTDGPTQGIRPVWSPDGMWIVHAAVNSLGSGAGYDVVRVFAAAADDTGVKAVYTPPDNSGDEVVHGWLNDSTFVVSTWRANCGFQDMRSVDILTSETIRLWSSCFGTVAVDTADNTLLVSVGEYFGATDQDKPGVYLFNLTADPVIVAGDPGDVAFLPTTGMFYHSSSGGDFQVFSPAGDKVLQQPRSVRGLKTNAEGTQFYWLDNSGTLSGAPASGAAPDFDRAEQIATGVSAFGVVN